MSTSVQPPRDAAPPVVLRAEDLRVDTGSGRAVLHGISFELRAGRILALVGESGSGKTTAGLACLGHFRRGLRHTGGSVRLVDAPADPSGAAGRDVLGLPEADRRRLRGGVVSYVPQDPALSLDPAMRVGEQIVEVLRVHGHGSSERERAERVAEVLEEVGLPSDTAYRRRYPHQLSGGQQQRVGIAMAVACRPSVVVLDEPTTGLDVTTQALVLETVRRLAHRHRVAGLYITHDLAVVAEVADEVAVMLAGEVVERGPCEQMLTRPGHPYTRTLLRAVPDLAGRRPIGSVPPMGPAPTTPTASPGTVPTATATPRAATGVAAPSATAPAPWAGPESPVVLGSGDVPDDGAAPGPLLAVRQLRRAHGEHTVLDGVDLDLAAGESLMLLGESGSGKTTLSRCLAGLDDAYTGSVALDGERLAPRARQRSTEQRRRVQYVFQSPYSSLNPRRTVAQSVEVPLRMDAALGRGERRRKVLEALEQVRLGPRFLDRRPGELSGGERQRVAVARALVNAPSVLVCDEVTSALDVSVQASIVELLRALQDEHGMALLFVTHNIALARYVSQRLAVLQAGRIVELGPTAEVLGRPRHPYTQQLLADVPTL